MRKPKATNRKSGAAVRSSDVVSTPHVTDWKALDAQMLKYRKEHFAVEVKPAEHPLEEGEVALSTTQNGYQWQTITLLKSEVEKVIAALSANDEFRRTDPPLKP